MDGAAIAPQYWLTRFCFQRAMGFIYLVAFLVTAQQFKGLIGEHGLLPSNLFIRQTPFWDSPSLFWLDASDRFLSLVAWAGVGLSLLTVTGFSERFGIWFSAAVWFFLWLFYLSFVNIGQVFYGFGWETMLLEAGFLCIFFGSSDVKPPAVIVWLLRWMLFRLMFGAGLIKMRGDACWRDLTCMFYHYETQPIPNPLSWYLHRLPPLVHKAGTLFTHFTELAAPWGYFVRRPVCAAAGILTIIFQVMLILSGNLSWLNYLTIALAIGCFDDAFLSKFIPIAPPELQPIVGARQAVIFALTGLVLLLSIQPALNLFSRRQLMNASFEPLHLVNTYGAFGSITKRRMEIVIEGTDEAAIFPYTQWKEYQFKAKPGDPARMPAVVAPYHLRLDWLMWFAAMSDWRYHPWFLNLIAKLLENDREVLKLIDKNPFPDKPPHFVRAVLYHYRFTDPNERRETDRWWFRSAERVYFPPVSLNDDRFREALVQFGWLPGDAAPAAS